MFQHDVITVMGCGFGRDLYMKSLWTAPFIWKVSGDISGYESSSSKPYLVVNELFLQQGSWYYQPKHCIFLQENLPQRITVQILPSSSIPPQKKVRLPFHGRQHVVPPGHQPQISGVPKLVEQHPSQGCASSWWPIHLHGGLPGQRPSMSQPPFASNSGILSFHGLSIINPIELGRVSSTYTSLSFSLAGAAWTIQKMQKRF